MILKKISFWEAVSTIVGGTIGAGMLAIPYAVLQSGFLIGLILIIVITGASIMLNLMLSYVILRTHEPHQFPGLVGVYLGKTVKKITFISLTFASYAALLAFIIGEGQVLYSFFGGTPLLWSLLFFITASIAVLMGLSVIKRLLFVMVFGIVLILGIFGFHSWHLVSIQNLSSISVDAWVIPYGVLLFAFHGTYGVLNARKEVVGQEKLLSRAIIVAGVLIACIYSFFVFLTLGVTGIGTTPVATIGLGLKMGPILNIIGNVLAAITMASCFISVGYGLSQMYEMDFKKSRITAWLLVVTIPLVLFFTGIRDFVTVISASGGILIGITSIVLVFAFWNAQKYGSRESEVKIGKTYIIGFLLLFLFIFGIYLTIAHL